jgi:uncharacterized protein YndB with AHSA1/START domain
MRRSATALVVVAVLTGNANAQETRPIVAEVVMDASIEEVWDAWTTRDGLRAWMAPHAEIDLRLGGLLRTNYHPRGTIGDSQTIENVILSFEPGRMLSIRVARFPSDFPFPNAIGSMWTVVYLEPVEAGRTKLRVVSLGFGPDDESRAMRAFFERGNAFTVQQLQAYFSRSSR